MQHTVHNDRTSKHDVREALIEIIEGSNVKRSKHELIHEGQNLTSLFEEELLNMGYRPRFVDDIEVRPGERVPAFFIDRSIAYFGWVFWEQFTTWKLRKLWGSVIKNVRGDWDIQLPAGKKTVLYANESLRREMDIDHPPEF